MYINISLFSEINSNFGHQKLYNFFFWSIL